MNYNYQKLEDIKIDSALVKSVNFKPKSAPIVCLLIGILMMIVNNFLVRLLGAFFIIMALVVFKFVEDRKVIDVYEKGCLLYHPKDQTLGYYLNYDDVKMWKVSRENGHDQIIFTLRDGNRTFFESFQISKAYNALDSIIHDKEERAIQAKKNKQMHWEIRNPFKKLFNKDKK